MTAEVEVMDEQVLDESPALKAKLADADDEASSCDNHSDGPDCERKDTVDSGIDSGGGGNCDSASPDIPDDETADQIMKMVEYYLSDANILKDPFLLKHVKRNKEGYVSLKLLASFRKVRSLSRNWKAVAFSVQKSNLLAVNSELTKVRRVAPLPDHDETLTSRSVIVYGFSTDKPSTVDCVSEMFSQCGDIALVRILRPGGSIPSDVKRFLSKTPDIQSEICALVEFEEHAAASKALEVTQADGIKVISLTTKEKSSPESPKKVPAAPQPSNNGTTSPKESPKKKKKNRKSSNADKKNMDGEKRSRRSSSGSVNSQSSGYLSSSPNPNPNPFESKFPRRHSYSPAVLYNDPKSSFASLKNRHSGSKDRLQTTVESSDSSLNPWRRRREQLMLSDSNLLSSSSLSGSVSLMQSVPVSRLPRGPDGTNGFGTRARPVLPSTAE